MTCNNKNCVKHLSVVHGNCILTGTNRCRDLIHNRECHTQDDLDILKMGVENAIEE